MLVFFSAVVFVFYSFFVYADSHIARFVFITEPQDISIGAISEPFTVQLQDTTGEAVKAGETLCLGLSSDSETGEFSSNKDNWKPVEVLTINSNWASRTFYYKNSASESGTLRAEIAVKQEMTCAAWPREEWEVSWSAKQSFGSFEESEQGEAVGSQVIPPPISSGSPAVFIPEIQAYAGDDATVVVGSMVSFRGYALNNDGEEIDAERYWWNFGDGTTSVGEETTHIFILPGMYTIGLHISSGVSSASDFFTVTVVPNKMVVKEVVGGSEGYIMVRNASTHDIDIGGWRIEDDRGEGSFTIPPKTKIRAGAETAFANSITGFFQEKKEDFSLVFYYANGSEALKFMDTGLSETRLAASHDDTVKKESPHTVDSTVKEVIAPDASVHSGKDSEDEGAHEDSIQEFAQTSAAAPHTSSSFFFLLAFGLSIAAAGGFLVVRSRG